MAASLPVGDKELIQIMDAALSDATKRAGAWLVCRPGCTQCCIGPFPISQLDAARLRNGLAMLEKSDPQRANRVRERTRQAIEKLSASFPGDPVTGILDEGDDFEQRFADFANDEPCPVLDPKTGTCDLYASRPMTCRTFGPPVRTENNDTLGICELCFQGASTGEISACEMEVDADGLEPKLIEELENATGVRGKTIVAFSLIENE
ncbi:MAG TPA: YkgJ family cysteine cluster protein [Candidatus Angelobacter sp.]|jgi:Fe-S-cluster containining protein|nr:YkgJ family cysteine cluster protein [Candidatus Angelobacter sp.]